jgi:hypothetical protein
MYVFPETRCPECGTRSTGKLCPSCRERLWPSTFHHIDPDGEEAFVDGCTVRHSAEGYSLFWGDMADDDGPPVEWLYEGRPVTPINGGFAWERLADGAQVYSADIDVPEMGDADTPRRVPLHWADGTVTWAEARPADADAATTRPDLVTLNQAAWMVHRTKRTLETWKAKGELPAPEVDGGGGGNADYWHGKVLRPALPWKN